MSIKPSLNELKERFGIEPSKSKEIRTPYQRDRGRIIHSANFRRLQTKTQVLGVGEGDFHRTRLTHSLECAQTGYGLLHQLEHYADSQSPKLRGLKKCWLPERDLIEACCLAHDIGHPPFGHGGEKLLFDRMRNCGGFEGNAQTLRILCKLEKYTDGNGINPTRRLILGVLKYPVSYAKFSIEDSPVKGVPDKPPKCFYAEEQSIVNWALEPFSTVERENFQTLYHGKAKYKTLDCSIMDLADDIAYGVHDIEDILARKMLPERKCRALLEDAMRSANPKFSDATLQGTIDHLLSEDSFRRKQIISRLVGYLIKSVEIKKIDKFKHPLLKYNVFLPEKARIFLDKLKSITLEHVAMEPHVQQLERRGQYLVGKVFDALSNDPHHLIPKWETLNAHGNIQRNLCDYVAGMTDDYLEKVYSRLFVPGYGASTDEL